MAITLRGIKQSIGKFFLGNSTPLAGLWSWAIPGTWNGQDLLKQYTRYVYAIISAIAEEAGKVEFEVKKGDKVLKAHPFLNLIKKPNPDASQFQFLEMHFTFMKLTGESFWYLPKGEKTKKPKEIYLLRPDRMEVNIAKENNPRGLVTGYAMRGADGKKIPFERDEIIHFKMPNPENPKRGLGTVQASKTYIETEEYGANWTKFSLFNSGRPSGVLSIKGMISDDEFKQVKKQFAENYSGTANAGKTMLLKGADGLSYQKLGMELGEVALKELKEMTRDDIMVMFRVSKTILGISDDVNRANAFEARQVFTRNVIMPELDRFIDTLNAFLMPLYGDDSVLSYADITMESDEDKLKEWETGHNKWLTTNDIRRERGLAPVVGGDVFYRPLSEVAITQPAKESSKGLKKKELREQRVEVFNKLMFATQDAWEKQYKKVIDREFETQRKEILARHKKGSFPSWEFDIETSNSRLFANLTPMSVALMQEASKYALELAGDDKTQLEIDDRIRNFVHDRVDRLVRATNDETISSIEQTISDGVVSGESVAKLKKRINEVYDYATKVRSERIARTETLAASNQGALDAYKQSPLVMAKEWSTERDACEFCRSLNGKIINLEEDFAKLGTSLEGDDGGKLKIGYTNISAPPAHPNCRCTILPVAK